MTRKRESLFFNNFLFFCFFENDFYEVEEKRANFENGYQKESEIFSYKISFYKINIVQKRGRKKLWTKWRMF